MQKITPHLWFDTQAKEAAKFYTSLFPNSKVTNTTTIHNTPSGDCDIVSFELSGFKFMSISAGPLFKFNPSVSFMVNFDPKKDKNAKKNIETLWKKLSAGGKVLMPFDKYPFSEGYGWTQDKYGLSWQLILSNPEPALLFVNDMCGKAEEATDFYISIFKNATRGALVHYPANASPNKEGTVMFTDFQLENQWFAAMDGALKHEFAFNEAISFIVNCDTQEEIDYYWKKLSVVPEAEQCGWCKDPYGVSWQIHPAMLDETMKNGTREQIDRLTKAFLPMKKFDIAVLIKAFDQQ